MSDLDALWAKACPEPIGPWDDLWALRKAGVSAKHLHGIGALDIRIENGRWIEWFRGDRAIIIPVCDDDGDLIDLVAFRLDTPRSFWTHDGTATMLGREHADKAQFYKTPLTVLESPLEWLRAKRQGVVILNWNQYWPLHMDGIPALQIPDKDFARRARNRFERPFPIPPIWTPT